MISGLCTFYFTESLPDHIRQLLNVATLHRLAESQGGMETCFNRAETRTNTAPRVSYFESIVEQWSEPVTSCNSSVMGVSPCGVVDLSHSHTNLQN